MTHYLIDVQSIEHEKQLKLDLISFRNVIDDHNNLNMNFDNNLENIIINNLYFSDGLINFMKSEQKYIGKTINIYLIKDNEIEPFIKNILITSDMFDKIVKVLVYSKRSYNIEYLDKLDDYIKKRFITNYELFL